MYQVGSIFYYVGFRSCSRSPPLQKSWKQIDFKIFGGKNMNEYDYTGNKTKNYFTAYLQKCIRWKRMGYLKKKERIQYVELPLDDELQAEDGILTEEIEKKRYKEDLLLKECDGIFPKWNELSDKKLITALLLLSEEERQFIYQHVFEERTFGEMETLNGV